MKCKTIDRLALTREKFGGKMYGDTQPEERTLHTLLATPENDPLREHRAGYSICPQCGQETLIHEDGCMRCQSCMWSACG